jgi:hypothetical protein
MASIINKIKILNDKRKLNQFVKSKNTSEILKLIEKTIFTEIHDNAVVRLGNFQTDESLSALKILIDKKRFYGFETSAKAIRRLSEMKSEKAENLLIEYLLLPSFGEKSDLIWALSERPSEKSIQALIRFLTRKEIHRNQDFSGTFRSIELYNKPVFQTEPTIVSKLKDAVLKYNADLKKIEQMREEAKAQEKLDKQNSLFCPRCKRKKQIAELIEDSYDQDDGWITVNFYRCSVCRERIVDGFGNLFIASVNN